MIRPFTVRVNCQTRGLTSIRRGLGKDHIPFPVNSNSIIASENVSGGLPIRRGQIFSNSEGSQSERGLVSTKPEGSQSGGVSYLLTHRGPNPEGS